MILIDIVAIILIALCLDFYEIRKKNIYPTTLDNIINIFEGE